MKKVLLVLVTVALLTSCGKSLRSAGGEVTGVRSVAFNEPAPYGMVLVKRGSFEMGPADKDSLWGIMPETKGVSFDAFWMDQTEVTNAKYRQFVYYVRDSIIRERLADPAYGGNDLFKITEDGMALPIVPVASSRILCINSYAIRRRQSLVPKKHRLRDNHRNPDERNTYGYMARCTHS